MSAHDETPSGKRKPSIPASPLKKVALLPFVFVMYSYTTAGPFGLEDQISNSGPGMALLYQLLIPFFWCVPMSLVAAELTTAMPVEGGFYRWTRRAFGDFWGFLAGWWNWCASFLLGALYAVLFADYLAFYFPQLSGWRHYSIAVLVIAVITYLNVRGIRLVGGVATLLEVGILASVLALCASSVPLWRHNPFLPIVPLNRTLFQVFGVGFALGLWLYAGYEQVSSVAEEVEEPQRSYPKALAWVVPLSMLTYLLPTACSLAALDHWEQWHTGYFSQAAALIGGPRLGFVVTTAAVVMNLAILNSTMLATTRIPSAMAKDGYLADFLSHLHPEFGTPSKAILVSAAIYCLLAWHNVLQLISVYVWLRVATSVLTVLSAWQMRRKDPEVKGSFRIPGGRMGLTYAVVAPIIVSAVAIIASDRFALKWGPPLLLLGPVAYALIGRNKTANPLSLKTAMKAPINSDPKDLP